MWVITTRFAPASLGVLARLLRGEVAAQAGALRARQGSLDDQQVGVAGDLDDLVARAGVGAVGDLAAAPSEPIRTAKVSTKCGTGWKLAWTSPTSTRSPAEYSSIRKALSIRSSLPQAPTTRRKVSTAPGGAISRGRAGSSVPSQVWTGTGCCFGA